MTKYDVHLAWKRFIVDSYVDNATCVLSKSEECKQPITEVILHPVIIFIEDNKPDKAAMKQIFKTINENYFIHNSIISNI